MRKLKLRIDELAVDSFETLEGSSPPGTVFGRETEVEICGSEWGTGQPTCQQWATCEGRYETCNLNGGCFTMDADQSCVPCGHTVRTNPCTCP